MTDITVTQANRLASRAIVVGPRIAEKIGDGRTGGYLYISDSQNRMLVHIRIGAPDDSKLQKYIDFSREKATRLCVLSEHHLSWQSRNPKLNKWGGAVRLLGGAGFISFSGFPEQVDEALCLTLACGVQKNIIIYNRYHAMSDISNNTSLFIEMYAIVSAVMNN